MKTRTQGNVRHLIDTIDFTKEELLELLAV